MNIGLNAAKNDIISSSAMTLLDHLFHEAYLAQASDIHFDSLQSTCRIQLRVKGTLKTIFTPPKHLMPTLINRLKIMAQLDITEQRQPQDGQLIIPISTEQQLEARISTLPTVGGEKISIRLFQHGALLSMANLGLKPDQLSLCYEVLQQPSGLILTAGPTGSGKTTTLYAFLDLLKRRNLHLLSLEQPVERTLEGVNQVNVNEAIGLGFDRLLSACLRHDPDILMIGEIRDKATAMAAIKAAETGHLVLSSIHAGSSYDTLLRLIHLGVDQHAIAASLLLILHQRLLPCSSESSDRSGLFECCVITPALRSLLFTLPMKALQPHVEMTWSVS